MLSGCGARGRGCCACSVRRSCWWRWATASPSSGAPHPLLDSQLLCRSITETRVRTRLERSPLFWPANLLCPLRGTAAAAAAAPFGDRAGGSGRRRHHWWVRPNPDQREGEGGRGEVAEWKRWGERGREPNSESSETQFRISGP